MAINIRANDSPDRNPGPARKNAKRRPKAASHTDFPHSGAQVHGDLMHARDIISKQGSAGLFKALDKGAALPAALRPKVIP